MSLTSLPSLLRDDPAMMRLLGTSDATVAVPEPARAYVIAGLAELSERSPILVATPTNADADRLTADLRAFLGPGSVDSFPAWETLPFERVSPATETMGRRLRTMWRMRRAAEDPRSFVPRVVTASVKALVQRLGPHVEESAPLVVEHGATVEMDELVHRLVAYGYRREYQVEHRGELAVRGGILDVFPSTSDLPVRIDLWGDEVDRLAEFDAGDQRSTGDLDRVEIFACREVLPSPEVRDRARGLVATDPWGREQWERLAEGLVFDGMESWLPWLVQDEHLLVDLLGSGSQVVLVEPRRIRDRAKELLEEEESLASALAQTWGATREGDEGPEFPRLHLGVERLLQRTAAPVMSLTSVPESPQVASISASGWDPVTSGSSRTVERLKELSAQGYRVTVCADTEASAARMSAALSGEGLRVSSAGERDRASSDEGAPGRDRAGDADGAPARARAGDDGAPGRETASGDVTPDKSGAPGIVVLVQPLERGFVVPSVRVGVLSESDITGRRRPHRRARPRARYSEGFFDDLEPGDFVVHHQHGVARYGGMVRRSMGGGERDYLLLEYRGDDKLYVPSDQIDAITPYTGGESPALNRLGGSDWQRTRSRVKAAVREIAQELVVLYRRRVTTPGHAFASDTPWQRELEDSFVFTETPDQLKAVREIKQDMEEPVPMDRLLCGDVGFGKTEVAIRAAFKAVQDGKQAAVLVPTTLLAQQHFQTFSERFSPYPIRVEVLSRFLTPQQARRVADGLADGSVDVVVGTHRLLSEDVRFKDLGLLVVDEEQRFGVSHKEAIKQVMTGVDVLTLSANPIPRTLEMSLTGIRDLTLLSTPPAERQPILTYVGEYDELAVSEAIRRELLREGQVFFVHNRIRDIDLVASRISELVPEARVAVAHGQMDEGSLERVVLDFWEGGYDVLVCTTIIESGIDMPTVNTLVVDRSDRLGLGQLHQIRGRVGRAGQRAYAYLFYPRESALSEQAYERLRTIGEQTELGSGFKIAMRDLEIRGAGNLLGSDQSGHIAAVGYDLYVQMVSEAVSELKGEEPREPAEIKLDLPVVAHLPTDYVEREDLRLEAYRRLASVTEADEVDDIRDEWLDRYGPVPPPAESLLAVGRLRAECSRLGIKEVTVSGARPGSNGRAVVRLSPLELLASARIRLQRLHPGAVFKEDAGQLVLPLDKGASDPITLVEVLQELVPPPSSTAAVEASSTPDHEVRSSSQ